MKIFILFFSLICSSLYAQNYSIGLQHYWVDNFYEALEYETGSSHLNTSKQRKQSVYLRKYLKNKVYGEIELLFHTLPKIEERFNKWESIQKQSTGLGLALSYGTILFSSKRMSLTGACRFSLEQAPEAHHFINYYYTIQNNNNIKETFEDFTPHARVFTFGPRLNLYYNINHIFWGINMDMYIRHYRTKEAVYGEYIVYENGIIVFEQNQLYGPPFGEWSFSMLKASFTIGYKW